jgi:S1-C subfamily serine protease
MLGLLLPGCPKPPVESPKEKTSDERPATKGPKGKEVTSVKLPKSMVIGDNVSLSGFYEDDPEAGDPGMDEEGMAGDRATDERPSGASKGGAGPSQNIYRVVAPATVIVRSQRGYGTGVIYDPAGWILTNNHVIAHAQMDAFRMKVTVGLGRLNKQGVMEERGKTYEAYVHKKDPLRDIAVLKLINPPKDLVAVKISDKDPAPGQKVTSIGHAGIGLLWALKGGQIAAIGKLSTHLAELQLYHESKSKGVGGGLTGMMKKKRLAELRKYLQKKIPALVIQSTADISQGDSGGPLVNSRAELVGLNAFVRSSFRARKESNFHIHVAEVRKFIKEVPKKAPQLLPDPWTEGGSEARMGDADMDGTVDTLAMFQVVRYGFFRRKMPKTYFIDVDQDSFQGRAAPEVKTVVEKKDFDAELIFLSHGNYLYTWYDTNGDRKPDVLLLADSSKTVKEGFRIGADGELKKDDGLVKGPLIRASLLPAAMHARLGEVGGQVFGHHLMPSSKKGERKFPNPIRSAGHTGTLKDLSRDGKPDTVAAEGLFSSGFLFDLDQDTLGSFKAGDSLHQLRQSGKKIDAEVTWVALKRGLWAFYDTDNNGSFDLLLHTHRYPMNFVNEAWTIGADGKHTPTPGFLGQYMVQPDLLKDVAHVKVLRTVAGRVLGSSKMASGAGIKAFPDPNNYYRWGFKVKDAGKLKSAAVEVRMYRCQGLLIDVDRDTARKAKKEKSSLDDMVKTKKFDAEYAQVQCGSDLWAFYDTRGKGYDVVLYTSKGASSAPEVAYLVDKKGVVKPREKKIACDALAIPRLFKKAALRRNFAKIGKELLRKVAPAKCKP